MPHNSDETRALSEADQRLTRSRTTNATLIAAASVLLDELGDPARAWAVLGARLMQDMRIGPGDPGAAAVEMLAAMYVQQAQTRAEGEEGR
ncbi:hypothetical protein [Nocardiopsis synnemataformans]|uniref:hypothetical protein n=1 Tax=Nocardiopsis synnemataformans TaxID=61305 RepID=UPI003EBFB8BF